VPNTYGGPLLNRRLKRSNRANPREDRNSCDRNDRSRGNNIIELEQFSKSFKKNVDIIPRSINQETYLSKLEDPNVNIVFAVGPSGTGKSLLATLFAIRCLKEGEVKKVVITRPSVSVDDQDIGFLPGDIYSKMAPWTRPILEIFEEYYSVKTITNMIENNVIELLPMAYLRGRTLKDSVIILDEAQNTTTNSMMSALTRIGEGSKMIVTGDIRQSDRSINNGLSDFMKRYTPTTRVAVVEFQKQDVERHPVIGTILKWYNQE
jgi:phosphate starvation-inducible PhoH-like protein